MSDLSHDAAAAADLFRCPTWIRRHCGYACCSNSSGCYRKAPRACSTALHRSRGVESCLTADCRPWLGALRANILSARTRRRFSVQNGMPLTDHLLHALQWVQLTSLPNGTVEANATLAAALEAAVELERTRPGGLWLEFCAASGRTTQQIAMAYQRAVQQSSLGGVSHDRSLRQQRKVVFSFDSFWGLPETWRRGFRRGLFSRGGIPPFRSSLVSWQVGPFNSTLPRFLAKRAVVANVSFVHVDCDLYSSASLVLRLLAPYLAPGAILAFDDLINYPGWRLGEVRALDELLFLTGRTAQPVSTAAMAVLPDDADLAKLFAHYGEGLSQKLFAQQAAFRLL